MDTDVQAQILIYGRLGGAYDMSQADLFSGNPQACDAKLPSLQMFIVIVEQFFKQFFLCHSGHGSTPYLFVILQTTYSSSSRK